MPQPIGEAASLHLIYGACSGPMDLGRDEATRQPQQGTKATMLALARWPKAASAWTPQRHCSSYINGEVLPIIGGYGGW